jgi:hypothetical protein
VVQGGGPEFKSLQKKERKKLGFVCVRAWGVGDQTQGLEHAKHMLTPKIQSKK